jgi:hypothetical protein
MKKVILSIIILFCFLNIRISNYTTNDSSSIFELLMSILFDYRNWNYDFSGKNLFYILLEFIFLSSLIVFSVFSKKILLELFSVALLFVYWILLLSSFYGVINSKLFVLSSIPFLALNSILAYFIIKSIIHKKNGK